MTSLMVEFLFGSIDMRKANEKDMFMFMIEYIKYCPP